jgi:hypothetical protein
MNKDTALDLALEALSTAHIVVEDDMLADEIHQAITAIKQARSAPVQPVAWPAGLIDRIKAAEQRIQDGHAPRRIPADPTDVDLVLAEVRYLLEGKQPPFWIKTTPPAQPAPVPVEWMEMVTANLVREGVNKHKARELAEHFYGLAQRPFVELTDEEISDAMPGGIYDCLNDPWDCGVGDGDTLRSIKKDVVRIARTIEAKLKEKNNG